MGYFFLLQIRNYVLHPYKLVKDARTGVQGYRLVIFGVVKGFLVNHLRH